MKTINTLLMFGLFSASLAAQATTMTAKPNHYSYGKPASSPASTQPMMAKPATPAAAPAAAPAATPANTSSQPMMAKPATPPTTTPTPAAPAPASSGMGGVVGGMAAGALVGAGATMLLNSNSGEKQAATTTPANAPAPSNLVYTGNVEQDFVSAMTLWQEKRYTDVINMSAPYTKCTRCSDKEAFMIELNQLAKKNVGQ
jgi:hypothetical protein